MKHPPPRLTAKAQAIGLDFENLISQGRVEILWQPPLEVPIDALAQRLLAAVRRRSVRRLFIDGLDGFRQSAVFPERLGLFFTALTHELRALDVTTLVSLETAQFVGPVAVPIPDISASIDNILFLRQVELRSQLYRLVSILKTRESDYDSAIRQFTISSQGIEVASTFESAEAILTGIARPLPVPGPSSPSPAPQAPRP